MTLDELLQPIAGSNPGGVALLHEPEFDAIAAARREDDPTLPRGVWTAELKRADWPEVARLCRDALAARSKDLQVAAWLGEAWIALDGAAGGARATTLVRELCERFWDSLHPLPRGKDIEFRTAPLDWLDAHWSTALLVRVPLVRGSGAGASEVTLAGWREALAQENIERKDKKAAPKAGTLSAGRALALAQVRSAEPGTMAATLAGLRAWTAELEALQGVLDRLLPGTAPHPNRLRALLAEAQDVLAGWMGGPPEAVSAAAPAATAPAPIAPPVADTPADPAPAAAGPVPIASRSDAYGRLHQIADYLARLEPHSPVPVLLRRAVAWGGMPFEQLMKELTHNNNEMQKVLLRDALE